MRYRFLYIFLLILLVNVTAVGQKRPVNTMFLEHPVPENGTEIVFNAPVLRWPYQKGKDIQYDLELSQDSTFSNRVIKAYGLVGAMFNPHQSLALGKWYWRYRVVAQPWSTVIHFIISPSARTMVSPSSKNFLAAVPLSHPRILVDKSSSMANNPENDPIAKVILAEADKALQRNLIVEQDVKINRKGETPAQQKKINQDVVVQLGYSVEKQIASLCQASLIQHDPRYAAKAIEQAMEVARWDHKGITSSSDFTDGFCMYSMALVFDTFFDQLTKSQQTILVEAIKKRATGFYQHWVNSIESKVLSGHVWQLILNAFFKSSLALYHHEPAAADWLEYAYELFLGRAPILGGLDGGWEEGVYYLTMNMDMLVEIPEKIRAYTGFDFINAHPWYRNNADWFIYHVPPGSAPNGYGDNTEGVLKPPAAYAAFATVLGSLTGNTTFDWYVQQLNSYHQHDLTKEPILRWYRFTHHIQQRSPLALTDPVLPMAHLSKGVGLVAMHTHPHHTPQNIMLTMRSSPLGAYGHVLADQNTFNILAGGERLFYRTGYKIAMDDPHRQGWSKHTRGQNGVLINDKGQPYTAESFGQISRFVSGSTLSYAMGDASNAYRSKESKEDHGMKKFFRHMVMMKPGIVVIYDELESASDAEWSWLIHSINPMQLDSVQNSFSTSVTDFSGTGRLWSSSPFRWELKDKFDVPATLFRNYEGMQHKEYPDNQWHLKAINRSKTAAVRFLSVIRVDAKGKPVEIIERRSTDGMKTITVDGWEIKASLSIAAPPALEIRLTSGTAVFSAYADGLKLGTKTYKATRPQHSLLVEVVEGKTHVTEAGDAQQEPVAKKNKQPNILFAIADDQSYPHAAAYGNALYRTPAFDSIAAAGVLFKNAFVAAPQCSPSRAAILTGKNIWQLEEAGTHSSYFPKKFTVFTTALENAGYFLGYTGKAWDPGNFKDAGWDRNPVGPEYNKRTWDVVPAKGISPIDYVSNFKDFLQDKPADQPFFFWYGSKEPHRVFEQGSGERSGLRLKDAVVPAFLPSDGIVKGDLLDYALEIGWFDQQLRAMLAVLKERGELENTIVVITADNGMAFPYAKANLQEFGTHVPLAIAGPSVIGGSRKVDDLVGLIDIAPTLLEMAGVAPMDGITGKSLVPLLRSTASGTIDPSRSFVLTGRERHTHARPDNLGYPARAIRTSQYLLIKNYAPERWPAGDPPSPPSLIPANPDLKPVVEGYEDIDASPTKSHMIQQRNKMPQQFERSFGKRNAVQLFDIINDPYCLQDLAANKKMTKLVQSLQGQLEEQLLLQGDPRSTGRGDVFESYPRFGAMKAFEGFSERGVYNPKFAPAPNIILILTDDLGWSSLSSMMDDRLSNSKSDFHETPNMDALSRQSLRFTRGYAPDPICSPTRRSILYGQSSIRQGEEHFAKTYAIPSSPYSAIPQVLKAAHPGYRTAHFGKWDLRASITPEQVGYDVSDGDNGNKVGNQGSKDITEPGEKWEQHFAMDNPKQMDSLTDRSIRFMRERAKQGEPFYLQVSHYATHANMETQQNSYEKFAAKPGGTKHKNPAWAAMLYDLDQRIGMLMKEVNALGLRENTYVFLMADNGGVEFVPPVPNRLDPPAVFSSPMRNDPLRGGKWTLYEGGIRVPFMVAGPGVQPGQTDTPVIGWDLLPTFYALAGGKGPASPALDGGSLTPLMFNPREGSVQRASECFYFHRFHNVYPHSAIISGNHKLIRFWKTDKTELYDLSSDIGETRDLSGTQPERVKDLEQRLLNYIKEVNPNLLSTYK